MPIAAIPDPTTDPARDFLDYLTAWSTVLAAVLALAAILYTGWQAKKSADALVRERRINFELDQLDRLDTAYDRTQYVSPQPIMRALRLLPSGELPRLRAR